MPMPKLERQAEPIDCRWSAPSEAFFFWRLVMMNKVTPEAAEHDIRMTKRQLQWLVHDFPLDARVIKQIFLRREETWKAFRYLCAHPEAAQRFQEEALAQQSRAHRPRRLRLKKHGR